MESFSTIALTVLGIVGFLRFRSGDLGDWLGSKFLNAGAPAPAGGARAPEPPGVGDPADGGVGVVGTTGWLAPLSGPITSGFGHRSSPGGIGSTEHQGLDIDGATGDPVVSARDGRVTYAGNSGGYGLRVDVAHDNGYSTRYGHLSKILVRVGQTVRAGERLGLVGATGTATGSHLHYEVHDQTGRAVDPAPFLPSAAGAGSTGGGGGW